MICEECGNRCGRGYFGPVCRECRIIYIRHPDDNPNEFEVREL